MSIAIILIHYSLFFIWQTLEADGEKLCFAVTEVSWTEGTQTLPQKNQQMWYNSQDIKNILRSTSDLFRKWLKIIYLDFFC